MYYAVAIGKKSGVFTTWKGCKNSVHGYSNARFKKFENLEDAKDYVKKYRKSKEQTDIKEENVITAYVDGSYNSTTGYYGSGIVFLYNGKRYVKSFSNNINDKAKMRNVAGEIDASRYAIEKAISQKIKGINIYYDYTGIEKWATGEWKAKNKWTKEYADFIKEAKEKIKINFFYVKGHSSDLYNDKADELAKKGCGIL